MYLNRLTAILNYLFGRRQKPALCPVRVRILIGVCATVVTILSGRLAVASVAQTGNVLPADNVFTPNVDEGIPNGNTWNIFEAVGNQTFFEGRHTDGADPNVTTDDTNVNFDIIVGKTSYGALTISGESALRDQDLIIGDQGTLGTQTQQGTGVVRITGFGSLYNNDPLILPAEVASVPGFKSQNPRSATGNGNGFDVYVGKWGTGTLEITAGARAEIQDSVLVGDNFGAVGNMVVDGIDSFVGNGGTVAFTTTQSDPHMAIIGRQGTGNLTISNGATMTSRVVGGSGSTNGFVAAALGSSAYTLLTSGGSNIMDAGGTGTATITGAGSKWTTGGSFQVGGFDNGMGSGSVLSTGGDLEGDNTTYTAQAGKGNLYVNNGGLLQINNAVGVVNGTGTTTPLLLAIGRFGTVQLNGGLIQVGSAQGSTGGGQNLSTPDSVQVINDGIITGTGQINTGVFRNRYLGQVRVNAGQSLVVNSSSQFTTGTGATPVQPLTNYGSIQVIGNVQNQAQLEFQRAPAGTGNPTQPFLNLPLSNPVPAQPAFTGGQISAQYATLRFGSGLENHSMLAFTAGTNNVFGRTVTIGPEAINPSGDSEDTNGDTAQVLVSGQSTTAVFHDDLSFGAAGDLNLVDGGKVVVLNQHSFTMGGNLGVELSYAHPTLITVGGDVGIGPAGGNNDLNITIGSDVLHTLKHGDSFEIIAFTGDIGNVNVANPTAPVVDYTAAPQFTDISFSPTGSLNGLVPQVQFADQGVFVQFLDPTKVGTSGAVAPDFNGDGVVDAKDFAIWKAHAGQLTGASVLDGDADGDGDVDGADFLKWQRNVGKPMPWTGAGSGSGSGSGSQLSTVPEPTSLAMLICGALASLGFGRRRARG